MNSHPAPQPYDPATINGQQLKALLRTFFRINMRGALAQGPGLRKRKWGLWGLLAFNFFMGVASTGLLVTTRHQPLLFHLLIHGMSFAFVGMVVLIESGQILFNPHEPDILGHLPVSRRTITAAKLINITLLTLLVAGAFNLAPTFGTLLLGDNHAQPHYFAPLAHVLSIVLLCIFCSSGVVLVYGVLARLIGRERFNSLLSWAQVAMTIVFIFGYQILFRVIPQFSNVDLDHVWWLWLVPPAWFAGFDALVSGFPVPLQGYPFALAIPFVTGIVAWLGITRLAGGLDAQDQAATRPAQAGVGRQKKMLPLTRPVAPWLRWWLRDPAERAAFGLARSGIARDREVRQRLFPSLAMAIIFPLIMVFQKARPDDPFQGTFHVALSFWMLLTIPTTGLEMLRFSQSPAASDVFRYAPLQGTGPLFQGTRKAILYYIVLPAAIGLTIVLFFVMRSNALAGLRLFACMLPLVLPASLMSGLHGPYIPFSRQPTAGQQAVRTQLPMMVMMFGSIIPLIAVVMLLKFAGFALTLAIELPILALLYYLMRRIVTRPRALYLET